MYNIGDDRISEDVSFILSMLTLFTGDLTGALSYDLYGGTLKQSP
jgi:hypothetical protein